MTNFLRLLIVFPLMIVLSLSVPSPAPASTDLSEVAKILGFSGQMDEGAFVVRFGRSDIKVSIDGEPMPTALGFGSWTAWKDIGKDAMVMGDLVLLEKEVNPVISALEEANIQVTALHNHFFYEQPRIMFMHIGGMGDPVKMARGIRNALDKTATPHPSPSFLRRFRACPEPGHEKDRANHRTFRQGSGWFLQDHRGSARSENAWGRTDLKHGAEFVGRIRWNQ